MTSRHCRIASHHTLEKYFFSSFYCVCDLKLDIFLKSSYVNQALRECEAAVHAKGKLSNEEFIQENYVSLSPFSLLIRPQPVSETVLTETSSGDCSNVVRAYTIQN